MSQIRVLFLCTGNSCRSQMAEGWLRFLASDRYESLSAGAKPAGYVHPLAIKVMREAGIDIAAQESKSIADFLPSLGLPPDVIISVCDAAARDCLTFPGHVRRIAMPFDDPAHATGTDDEKLACFRRVRDEIQEAIERFLKEDQPNLGSKMTAAESLQHSLDSAEVNESFTEAKLHLSDGSRLCFCHKVEERWAKALGPEAAESQPGLAGEILAAIQQFRLNAKHLDITFQDASRWENRL